MQFISIPFLTVAAIALIFDTSATALPTTNLESWNNNLVRAVEWNNKPPRAENWNKPPRAENWNKPPRDDASNKDTKVAAEVTPVEEWTPDEANPPCCTSIPPTAPDAVETAVAPMALNSARV